MSIRNYGRRTVATTTLAATAFLGTGVAPQAFAQETTTSDVADVLKVCAASTNVAVALDLGADLDLQKAATIKLIDSLSEGNAADFTLIVANGAAVDKITYNLPEDKEKAVDFIRSLEGISATLPADWDAILTSAHGVEGLDAVAVFSGSRVDTAFDAPASVLRDKGVTVIPVGIGAQSPAEKATETKVAPAPSSADKPKESVKETTSEAKPKSSTSKATTSAAKPKSSDSKATTSVAKPKSSTSKATTSAAKPKPSDSKATTSAAKPKSSTSKATTSAAKPSSPAPQPSSANAKPTVGNPAPSSAAPAPAPKPSNGGKDILGGIVDTGKAILGNVISNGGGAELIDKGKQAAKDFAESGGAADAINKGKELLGNLTNGGNINDLINFGKSFLPASATTSALAGTTDQELVLEYVKDTGLVDAEGNWNIEAFNAQLAEKGLVDANGAVNAVAVANALGAPQVVNADGTFNATELANLFSTVDLSGLLGAGDVAPVSLVSASVATPGVLEEDGVEVLPQALASTNVGAVVDSAKGDVAVKDYVLVAAADTSLQEQGNGVTLESALSETVVEDAAKTEESVEPTERADAKGLVNVSTAEEAFETIGSAFGDACDVEVVKEDKPSETTTPAPAEKEESRPALAATGASVIALAGFGLLSVLGAGFVISRRKK